MTEHAYTMEEAALAAAAQATEASVELIRFAREGAYSDRSTFADIEVVGKLADALKLALEIEGDPSPETYLDEDERALLTNLRDSVTAFLAGWVG